MKRIILVVILIMIMVMSSNVFAHSGRTDINGGHFEKYVVNNVEYVLNYHLHDKVTQAITKTICLKDKNILWEDRDKIDINQFLETSTPTITATSTATSTKSATVTTTPTATGNELPKTGEDSRIIIPGILIMLLGGGILWNNLKSY